MGEVNISPEAHTQVRVRHKRVWQDSSGTRTQITWTQVPLVGQRPCSVGKCWEQFWGLVGQSYWLLEKWNGLGKWIEPELVALGRHLEENDTLWKGEVSLGDVAVKERTSWHYGPQWNKIVSFGGIILIKRRPFVKETSLQQQKRILLSWENL